MTDHATPPNIRALLADLAAYIREVRDGERRPAHRVKRPAAKLRDRTGRPT